MPKGLPTAAQLWEGDISFFSIDTDLIQAAAYDFDAGALNQLPHQLPRTMQLQLTEVVSEEIVGHLMKPVIASVNELKAASDNLKRLAQLPLAAVDKSFEEVDPIKAADQYFRGKVQDYTERCRGGILSLEGEKLASSLFTLYFQNSAPFGKRKDKKSEFPDAASLLLLDQYAEDNGTLGVIASGDSGWEAYAEQSEHLYVVKSLDQLTSLFAATSEHAEALKAKVFAAVMDEGSALGVQLRAALEEHLLTSEWDLGDIYASSGRVEADFYDAVLDSYEFDAEDVNVWPMEDEPNKWIIELDMRLSVQVEIDIQFYVWDSIDREEVSIGSHIVKVPFETEVEAFLTCSDVQLEAGSEDWSVDTELAKGRYSIEGFDAEPDFRED